MVKLAPQRAEAGGVSIMRARLVMKMVTLVVTLVLTIMTARSCGGSGSPASPLNPGNLARNGLSGLCANQQAVNAASGDPTAPVGFQVPASDAALAGMAGLSTSSLSCSTTTTAPGGG